MPALRIPSGWRVGWNVLCSDMEDDLTGIGGLTLCNVTNVSRRFNIDVAFRPEFDPQGHFELTASTPLGPGSERGGRIKTSRCHFLDGQVAHFPGDPVLWPFDEKLEHWIARCSVWEIEGH